MIPSLEYLTEKSQIIKEFETISSRKRGGADLTRDRYTSCTDAVSGQVQRRSQGRHSWACNRVIGSIHFG